MKKIITIEDDDNIIKVLKVETNKGIFVLKGDCKRCGACCKTQNCEHLFFETINDVKVAICQIEGENRFGKFYGCKIYPRDPDEPLYEGCGYKWIKIS